MNRNLIIGIVVLVLIGGYFLLASNQPKKTATITPEATSDVNQAMSPTSAMPTLATQDTTQKTAASEKLTITASNYMFDLKEIKVKKGEPVTITLMNKEGFHDFVIDEFNAKTKQLKAGESETITFTPNKVGTFEYYCSVGQHRQMGMKGNLIVE
jgi:cytochrome c oxidase subunit 2